MREHETAKFKKYGSFFWLLLLAIGVVLPFIVSLIMCIANGNMRIDILLTMALVFAFIAWMILIMMIGYGSLTTVFIKRTAKGIPSLPYKFNSSFKSRCGILYIDIENGMIGFISAYNPMEIQVFSAARVSDAQTIASAMTGIRFVFKLDGKKITMPTLLTNKAISTTSGIGAEAVSKADTFVKLLLAAKEQAESAQG